MNKIDVRKDLPEKFYKESGSGYPVIAYTVGELKEALNDLPDDIEIMQDDGRGVHLIVYNASYESIHLAFEENEYDEDGYNGDEY
jgi:hypothetical protein